MEDSNPSKPQPIAAELEKDFILAPRTGETCKITGLTRPGYLRYIEPNQHIAKVWIGRKLYVKESDLRTWVAAGGCGRPERKKKAAK